MCNGKFITLEGGEGVGKSTLLGSLKAALDAKGLSSIVTREPGGSIGAELIRKLILNPPEQIDWSAMVQTLLFYAARADHLEKVIRPALDQGTWVICDRFSDSTRAYQAAAGGVTEDKIEMLDKLVVNEMQPDLTFVLDMPLEKAAERRLSRQGPEDMFEKLDQTFHARVRQAFLDISMQHSERCVVIDAAQSAECVLENALDTLIARGMMN